MKKNLASKIFMFFSFFIFSTGLCLPPEIPPSPPISDLTEGKSYWSLSENFDELSEKYQSCLIEKAEINGKLTEYEVRVFHQYKIRKVN